MKKAMTALLAIALCAPALAFAQDMSQQQDSTKAQKDAANQAATNDVNGTSTVPHHMMTGMVSNGGKTFTSDNTAYQVSNSDKLKNYDGQNVSIKYQNNTENNTIKVQKVQPAQ